MFFISSSLTTDCFVENLQGFCARNTEPDFFMTQTLVIFKNLATPIGESECSNYSSIDP